MNQEPVAKGKRGRDTASDFRAAMRSETEHHPEWPRPRARLALDLNFTTSKKQPPNLEKLAKHYLDQLAATHDEGEAGHLYRDDRQIQLLHIAGQHGWDLDEPRQRPGIWIRARTTAEAAADMQEASELPERDDDRRFDIDDFEWDSLREQLRDAQTVSSSSNAELRRAAPLMRFMALRHAQELLLHRNDRWLEHLFWASARTLLMGRRINQNLDVSLLGMNLQQIEKNRHALTRGILLGRDPHAITLPPLPGSPGASKRFREGIRHAIGEYVDQTAMLFPLLVPVRLTVAVVQPEQPRDLDNILLDLLPIIDDIMKPPQEPWLLSAAGSLNDVRDDDPNADWKRRGLRRLRSVIEHGVWSAQVLELKKVDEDPPQGALAVILGHGENMQSLWTEAASRLEDRDEQDHDHYW